MISPGIARSWEWEHIRTLTIVVVLTGLGEACWAIMQGIIWNATRPSGTFFNPNFLAGYLVVTWAILFSFGIYGHRHPQVFSSRSMPPTLWRVGIGSALSVVLIAVLLTESRGGMIVLLVATVIILVARYGWRLAASCAVLIVLVAVLVPTPLRERVLLEQC